MKYLGIAVMLGALAPAAHADLASELDEFVGYTIVAVKTVDGYQNADGKRDDGFEGCEYDRIIRFTDGTAVRCTTYSYSYSYRPRAAILTDGANWKLVVGDNVYSVSRNLR